MTGTTAPEPRLIAGLRNDDYHGMTDWWSSTQLKGFLPEQYKPFSGNSDALSFGTLVHTIALEPELAADLVTLDAATIGVKGDGTPAQNPLMTAAWKRAVAEVEAEGKTVVAQADWDRAIRMIDAVHDHPVAGGLIFSADGHSEESAFWCDETGIQHKARFDRRIPGAIVDLKTTASQPGAHNLTRAVINYGYELSAAHYLAGADALQLGAETFVHVWVEKVAPYRVTVTEMTDEFIARGLHLRDLALQRAIGAVDPYDGATGRLPLILPMWALTEDEMEFS